MVLVGFEDLGQYELSKKYSEKFNIIDESKYDKNDKDWILTYIEDIKSSDSLYDVTYITYNYEVVSCLVVLNIKFKCIYTGKHSDDDLDKVFSSNKFDTFLLENNTLEWYLSQHYDWVKLEQQKNIEEQINIEPQTTKNEVDIEKEKGTTNNIQPDNVDLNSCCPTCKESITQLPSDKNKLTLKQLLQDDVEITESDVRDLKATQNKLKVGMLLQAKSSLNRVLKLSNVLDKLYDEVLDRVDGSLTTTDTASLLYTTEYIAKALNDTNQFIMSLINNEKIQNFFVIDNSSVVNVGSIDSVDINKREKIRKAAEIVMDNIDYFVEGDFDKVRNPNIETDTMEEDNNVN